MCARADEYGIDLDTDRCGKARSSDGLRGVYSDMVCSFFAHYGGSVC